MAIPSDVSAKASSNTSLNSSAVNRQDKRNKCSGRGYSVEARVFHVIDASDIQLTPAEIARKIYNDGTEAWDPKKILPGQYTTVRGACTKLLQKGLVLQPYPGAYCNKITYDMRFVPIMLHNIRLHSKVCQDLKHWEVEEIVGGVNIKVCFGKERRLVSGSISCDLGMSHDACLFAVHRWFDIVEGRLGFALNDLVLTTWELNKDTAGIRIDGIQCVTKKDLYGMIERTYQKEENLVRKEWKVSTPMSLNKFEEAVNKGLAGMEKAQDIADLKKEVRVVGEALKFNNSRMLDLERLAEAQFNRKTAEADNSQVIRKEIAALRFDFNKLLAVMVPLFNVEGSQGKASDSGVEASREEGGKGYVS